MGEPSAAGPRLPAWEPQPDPIDVATPHAARVYGYWLGGKDNFPADRLVAGQVAGAYPPAREAALANRVFHERAVAWMAGAGIRQFLDAGCGFPVRPPGNTHQIAQRFGRAARVLYADHDPMVASHARALHAGDPGVAAVHGDVRDPGAILASPQAAQVLRPGEPAGLLLTAVLHYVEDEHDPAAVVKRFMADLAPGSCVAISHASLDKLPPDAAATALEAYAVVAEPAVPRTRGQVRGLFAALELLPPWKAAPAQIVTVNWWHGPGTPLPLTATAPAHEIPGGQALWAGVARKPA